MGVMIPPWVVGGITSNTWEAPGGVPARGGPAGGTLRLELLPVAGTG